MLDYYEYIDGEPRVPDLLNKTVSRQIISWTVLSRPVSVILLRIGFIFLHFGNVPIGNVNLIFLQNIVDICTVTLTYLLVGFIFSSCSPNGESNSIIGQGHWLGSSDASPDDALIGWQAIMTASAISTTGIVGRTHTIAYLLVAIVLSGFLQPVVIYWTWTTTGWMTSNELLGSKVYFLDHAGSATIHLVGGLTAFIGCLVLGKRLFRLRDIDEASINVVSGSTVFAGQLLIFLGLLGTTMPHLEFLKSEVQQKSSSQILLANLLAGTASSLLVVVLHFAFSREDFNHWSVNRSVHATIAGLVIVSGGINSYFPPVGIALACLGGTIFYVVSRLIFTSFLEDYCNVIATHLTCGFLGSFLTPLCVTYTPNAGSKLLLNFAWQILCLLIVIGLVTLVMGSTFLSLNFCGILRNRSEHHNHSRALTFHEEPSQEKPPRKIMQRIVGPDEHSIYVQSDSHGKENDALPVSKYHFYRDPMTRSSEDASAPRSSGKRKIDSIETKLNFEPGVKTKKLRHIHTLPAYESVLPETSGGAKGELLDHRDEKEDSKDSNKESKESKEIIKVQDLTLNKTWMSEGDLQREIIIGNARNIDLIRENVKYLDSSMDNNKKLVEEGNYKLRRTLKSMNLHQELEEQESKVKMILKPKYEDFFSSDSQDDNFCSHLAIQSNEDIKGERLSSKRQIAQDTTCNR